MHEIRSVGVIGGGFMGSGIAEAVSLAGFPKTGRGFYDYASDA